MSSEKYGPQFDGDRYANAGNGKATVRDYLAETFDAQHVVATEPDEAYDNFAEEKQLHQLLDYGGIDFVVDPFDAAPFGVNHRTHSPSEGTLRFDLRKETGTRKPSELDELLCDGGEFSLVPRYGVRAKRDGEGGFSWIRVVDLRPLVGAIESGLRPSGTWTDGDVVAWMFEYGLLRQMGVIRSEATL